MTDNCSGREPTTLKEIARRTLIRNAFRLEWITFGWMLIEAAVAISSGFVANSLTLIAFGIDSVIELISSGVLLWRLTVELKNGQEFAERAEQNASKIGGVLLYALAAYVIVSAAWSLWQREGQTFSLIGLILCVLAIPIMYWLSRSKLTLAEQLSSRALRADAVESITCGYLSFVVVVGLLAQVILNSWWVDAVTSLGIVYFLVKEAREAWGGDRCCE
jgi:divalent metal cation (Fe/Co/Zn/Cd) transporter